MADIPEVVDRFLRYVRIDTTADASSPTVPSSPGQFDLARLLAQEIREMGADDLVLDDNGYLYVRISGENAYDGPRIGLVAHLDTSPDAPGSGVSPIVHSPYDGGVIQLAGGVALDPAERPALRHHLGERIITSDGRTLLGSDDKAGVAVLMQLISDILSKQLRRPHLTVCFTIDEEIGRGVDHLDLAQFDADVAYTVDGGGIDSIQIETFNAVAVTFNVRGRGVHPGYAEGIMVNALHAIAALINRIPADERPETTSGRDGFYHVHHVNAGDVSCASMKWILRDFERAGIDRRVESVRAWADEVRNEFPGIEIELDVRHEYSNMRDAILSSDPRVVTMAHDAARRTGITLEEIPVRGGTDGARLSALGIPTPNIFNGGYDYHSVFEWNTVENLERSLAYLHALVRSWLDAASDTTS